MDHVQVIATELNLKPASVRSVMELLKDGGTVPFIARYRKEQTGALDEVQIRGIQERSEYLTELSERKTSILKTIEEQGKLTPELKGRIEKSLSKTEVEDLYLPFKPRRRTRATVARERGLEPLAELIWAQGDEPKDLAAAAAPFVDEAKEVVTADQAWAGARDIVAERISEDAEVRAIARSLTLAEGKVNCRVTDEKAGEKSKFSNYYEHTEPLKSIPSHRFLAIRRGEKEGYLRVEIETPAEKIVARLEKTVVTAPSSPVAGELKKAVGDAYFRLIAPSIENEVREELKLASDDSAIQVFAVNVRNLLLASPLGAKNVIGLDPGFRTGVKVAVIDATGKVLEHTAIYPFFGDSKKAGKKKQPKEAQKKQVKPGTESPSPEAKTSGASAVESKANGTAPAGTAASADGKSLDASSSDAATTEAKAAPPAETAARTEASPKGEPATPANASAAAEGVRPASPEKAGAAAEGKSGAEPEVVEPDDDETESRGAAKANEAKIVLAALLQRHDVAAIAIGNGTAGRETEAFVDAFLKEWAEPAGKKVLKVMVSEAGASVYSASDVAREEFPNLDLTVRGAISIGRRLQDPLAELVKIDPRSIGVGQYQHDVNQARLKRKLNDVVESCVNLVGVDVNTASRSLLSYVSGIGPSLAKRVVTHREQKGGFKARADLRKVSLFGEKAFEQAAGFLRISGAENPLDDSAVHPERYPLVETMATDLGVSTKELVGNAELAAKIDPAKYVAKAPAADATQAGEAGGAGAAKEPVGELTLRDILEELKKPGRDPRSEFSGPAFRSDVTQIKDLSQGMVLDGVITNVTNFGAFVDIGVHQDGLVHVSEISHQYVKDAMEVVKVGDRVKVKVLGVEGDRKRISLSIKGAQPAPAGAERPRGKRPPRSAARERQRDHGAPGSAARGAGSSRERADRGRADRPAGGTAPGRPGRRPGERGPRPPAGATPSSPGSPQGRPPQGRPPQAPGGRSFKPRAPRKVGTHGKTAQPMNDRGFMGPDRGPREKLPRQKGPDTSLGALFGDVLKKVPK